MSDKMLNDRQRSILLDALDCYRNHLLLSNNSVFSPEIMDGVDPASPQEIGELMEAVNPGMGNAAISPPESDPPAVTLNPSGSSNDALMKESPLWLEIATGGPFDTATLYISDRGSDGLFVEYRPPGEIGTDDPEHAFFFHAP